MCRPKASVASKIVLKVNWTPYHFNLLYRHMAIKLMPYGRRSNHDPRSCSTRSFYDIYDATTKEHYAVNVVHLPEGTKNFLVLKEIRADGINNLLSTKEALAACDLAVFVHDSSEKATELLVQVASHAENTGFKVPCLIVAATDNLDSFSLDIQHSTRVSKDMAPIPVISKLGNFTNVFHEIMSAAENSNLSITETEAERSYNPYQRLIKCSLSVSVGAAVGIIGLAAYCGYVAGKNAAN